MSSSSYHSQFDLAAARRWFTRRHRWASGLTAAALVLFLHQAGNAHDGSHGHDHPGPPPVVTLQITGLQKIYSVGQPVSGQVVVTSTERLKDSRLKIVMVDPDTCVSPTRCPQLFRQSYEVELKRGGEQSYLVSSA